MSHSDSLDACEKNLAELGKREKQTEHCKKVHIFEAVKQYFDGIHFESFLSDSDEVRQRYNGFCELFSDCLDFGKYDSMLLVCDAICSVLGLPKSADGFCRLLSYEKPQGARISCMRGSVSDEAYDRFSQVLDGATVVYADSFTDVCENLYHSHSDYAILPIENSNEGILSGLVALTEKYELFVSMVHKVERESDMSETSFALLSKNAVPVYGESDVFFATEAVSDKPYAELISSACEYHSAVVRQMQITSLNDGRYRTRCRFSIDEKNLSAFATALLLNVPGTEIRGVYREI